MRPKLVFCGPTISHDEAKEKLEAHYFPPAVQGSIVSAVLNYNPSVIVLIDGGFQTEPAVKHKEILWALSRDVAVVGASSMGALRAAELTPFMIGVGLVYRWYRRFALTADDAVAVQHGPAELNFPALTDALIDLRLTFRSAWRQGKIPAELAQRLNATARNLNFRERTLARVIAETLPDASDSERIDLHSVLASSFVQQKHADALQALALARSGTLQSPNYPGAFVVTRAFVDDLSEAGIDAESLLNPSASRSFT
jgi:hypothetical protein